MGDYLIIILLAGVVIVLLAGIVLMGIGGKKNEKYSNRLMVARVGLQAMLLFLLAFLFMSSKK